MLHRRGPCYARPARAVLACGETCIVVYDAVDIPGNVNVPRKEPGCHRQVTLGGTGAHA